MSTMDLFRDADGDLVGAWVVSYYRAEARERKDRADWMMEMEHLPSFEEAEALALLKPTWLEASITRWTADGPQETFSRRVDVTATGMSEIREILLEHSNIAPEAVNPVSCLAWAEDVMDSLNAGNGARLELGYDHSASGVPQTFELSDQAWEALYERD